MNIVKRVEAFCVPAVVLWVIGAPLWVGEFHVTERQYVAVWLALNVGMWLPEIIGALRRLHGRCF